MGGTLTELARPTVAKWAFAPASNFVIPTLDLVIPTLGLVIPTLGLVITALGLVITALGLVITALNFVIPPLSRDPEHMTGVRKEQQCGLDPGSSPGMTSL
jgi:hypothetical protein